MASSTLVSAAGASALLLVDLLSVDALRLTADPISMPLVSGRANVHILVEKLINAMTIPMYSKEWSEDTTNGLRAPPRVATASQTA